MNNPALFLIGKKNIPIMDVEKALDILELVIPGNRESKTQILQKISQTCSNAQPGNYSATMLSGNSGIGKSSIIKYIGELTNIPVIRFNLENILDSNVMNNRTNLNSIDYTISDNIYEEKEFKKLNVKEKKKYQLYKEQLPKIQDANNIIILKEKPNAECTIIEFDNTEALLNPDYYKRQYSTSLQLALADYIKNPRTLNTETKLTTHKFIYIFTSNLNEAMIRKHVGFQITKQNKINHNTLINIGFSQRFAELIDNIIELNDLNEKDFENYLIREGSQLHYSIEVLKETYGVNVRLDDSAIKVVSKYLVEYKKNLKGINEVTRRLLAPHYISPNFGTEIVIDSKIAKERLY
ncbi:MAG: hypothetical protein ACP5N1_03350 [Candidatus Woesearchaeota archaeon]